MVSAAFLRSGFAASDASRTCSMNDSSGTVVSTTVRARWAPQPTTDTTTIASPTARTRTALTTPREPRVSLVPVDPPATLHQIQSQRHQKRDAHCNGRCIHSLLLGGCVALVHEASNELNHRRPEHHDIE